MTTLNPDAPVAEAGTLLRELNHRIDTHFAAAISLMSVEAVRAEGAEAKAVLSNAVELLHGYAGVHRALLMPRQRTLIDAARYLGRLCDALHGALLKRLYIQLTLKGDRLPLQPERCWRLGLMVHELVTRATMHACFDGHSGAIKVKLARKDGLVNCIVSDNGSAATRARYGLGQGLQIVGDLARGLNGGIKHRVGAEFRSVVLSFPLTEWERHASCAIESRRMSASAKSKTRPPVPRARPAPSPQIRASVPFANAQHPAVPPARGGDLASRGSADPLRELLSSSHRMDVL